MFKQLHCSSLRARNNVLAVTLLLYSTIFIDALPINYQKRTNCSTAPRGYKAACEAGKTMPGKRGFLPNDKFSYQPLKRVSASQPRSDSRKEEDSYGSWDLVPYYKREPWNSLGTQAPAQPDRGYQPPSLSSFSADVQSVLEEQRKHKRIMEILSKLQRSQWEPSNYIYDKSSTTPGNYNLDNFYW